MNENEKPFQIRTIPVADIDGKLQSVFVRGLDSESEADLSVAARNIAAFDLGIDARYEVVTL